jgi:hypothetical protein
MTRRAVGHRYGRYYKELRRRFAGRMARGEVFNCWRCGEPINPAGTWDLGHVGDHTGAGGARWPEHRSCNRATVTNLKQRLAELESPATSRRW